MSLHTGDQGFVFMSGINNWSGAVNIRGLYVVVLAMRHLGSRGNCHLYICIISTDVFP